ncbi:MAG: ATP-dependent Clp protease proteolytic subunit [Verrucomicrobiae bacterium]|nr:ATP-dependent Clp protease proteolytic subunit [Verrucomicrobiae bacterium]
MRPSVHWCWVLLLAAFAAGAKTDEAASVRDAAEPKLAYVIPIRSDVNRPMAYVVRRGVKEAERAGADVVVLDMNTNGGEGDAMEEIMEVLEKFRGDTCTFVNTKAYSAGAFIAVATMSVS